MLNYLFIAATRCPRKDTKIGDYTISAGTIVFPNLYSMTTGYSLSERFIFFSINLKYKMRLETDCLKFRGSNPCLRPGQVKIVCSFSFNFKFSIQNWILDLNPIIPGEVGVVINPLPAIFECGKFLTFKFHEFFVQTFL